MHISELSYRYRTIFYVLLFMIVVGGIYAFMRISKLEDPEIVIMQAVVVTIYPGASAEEVEQQVTAVLENEIRTIPNISEIKSTSAANMSQINVLLKFSVPDKEIIQYWDILRKKIAAAKLSLPSGAQEPMVIDDFGDVFGMFYALTGDGFSYDELDKYADFFKKELLLIDGVKRVNIFGSQPSNIDIELSADKMSQLGVYPAQIVLAVNSATSPVYAGSYQEGDNTVRLAVNGEFDSIEDIKNLWINGFENDRFRLCDIANISVKQQEPARFTFLDNGKPALAFGISMESDVNVIDVGKRVDKRMNELMTSIPQGVEMKKLFFQPTKVSFAISHFMRDLIIAVVVVIAVLMLAMNFKSGLIICASLFIITLSVFPILMALGGTLQRISLGALVLALGMLVDDSIVVLDSILVALQQKKPLKTALFVAPRKTAMPLLCGTSIAIVAFLPVYLSKDVAATYIGDLFIVLCIALGVSWVVSLTQVPVFAAQILNFRKYRNNDKKPFTGKFYRALRKILNKLMQHKISTISVMLLLMIIAFFGFTKVKRAFFPDFLYDQAYVEYTLPKDVSVDRTVADMKKISADLLKIDGIKNVAAAHAMTPMRYCLVRAVNQIGDNYAEFIIDFDDYKTMQKLRPTIEQYFYDNYADAYSRFRQYNISIMTTHTVEVEFSGKDPKVLRNLEQQAEAIMRKCDLINQHTICADLTEPSKILLANYAQPQALQTGTSRTDASNALLAATDGLPIGAFRKDGVSMPINLKIRNKDGSRITDLNNLPVWNLIPNLRAINKNDLKNVVVGNQTESDLQKKVISPVPLSQITDNVSLDWEESVVLRTNSMRTIQAQCDPIAESSPNDVISQIRDEIEQIPLPEGYTMRWCGEHQLMTLAMKNIIKLLPLTAILIVFLLILLFNDLRKMAIVILCVPFAFIGIVPSLLLFGQPFSFVAIVGTIGMSGMLIRNSVVLIDEIDLQIEAGKTRYNSIIDATISRLRAVMMTSTATMLGVIPLLTDPMYAALSVTIIGGLLVGTVITLILLPILYAMFFGIKKN
ncbi:MAG: efflux RND transporter permease subunit [Prevotellaceae bacterium]|jgi:multidrug efflux pump subunit AcrB|nr:efflux RND transporter permease subunit [Prevotellaceae bacterium]